MRAQSVRARKRARPPQDRRSDKRHLRHKLSVDDVLKTVTGRGSGLQLLANQRRENPYSWLRFREKGSRGVAINMRNLIIPKLQLKASVVAECRQVTLVPVQGLLTLK